MTSILSLLNEYSIIYVEFTFMMFYYTYVIIFFQVLNNLLHFFMLFN